MDTNSRMTDSNAESNWMVPKARKVAKTEVFLVIDDEYNKKAIILETSKTND